MLDGLKRLFGASSSAATSAWVGVQEWAAAKHYAIRAVPSEGFVIDGKSDGAPWRLEWGPSQRPYIAGQELRLRCELGLASELQLVIMNRGLQEQMEKAVFEQYVEGVQTRIDNQTPPEMRWLVMFPKLTGPEMAPLSERFVALSSVKSWLQRWLDGPLTQALVSHRVAAEVPVVLMIGRGRLMIRAALPDPEVQELERWVRLFETAIRQAQRVVREASDKSSEPTVPPSEWSSSALPGEEHPPR